MHSPVQYLQKLLEKAAIHQKKEKFSDRLLKHSAFNVQVSNKPVVSTQQQLGSMEAGASGPLTNGPITQAKPLTQTLTQKPLESTGTNQVHDASSNPVRSSTPPKPPTPATTTKIPNVLKVARDTGLADVDGKLYINTEDVALLGKLGFEIGAAEYSGLEKSGEVLDLYSYLEKYAEVPKSVSSAVDKGEAFSGSFLKNMGYSVPKGYEIKGDLCCPVEKTALLEKESAEKTAMTPEQLRYASVVRVNNKYSRTARGAIGAAVGGLKGGLSGLIFPGKETSSTSEEAQPKSRLEAMRDRALIGAGIGAGFGFLGGHIGREKFIRAGLKRESDEDLKYFLKKYEHRQPRPLDDSISNKLNSIYDRIRGNQKTANALVVSGIHGDEPAGDIAAHKLTGTVDTVTDVNPTDKRRFEHKDINRHFDKPAEGSIQKKLLDLIEAKKPSSVISLHEDDEVDKPYAYSSKTMADKVKEALKGRPVASSAHGDVTDHGVISGGKNPPAGSLEKALDKRNIPHATIETPSKSESMDNRVKTHLDVVKGLLSKEAAERTYYHGSPMAGLKLLEPKLDPRQNVSGLFIHENPEIAALFALMPERHKATHIKYNTNTEKPSKPSSNFEVTVPHDKWLRDSGSLYEVSPPKGSVEFDPNEMDASGSRMLEMPVSPVKETKVTLQDLIAAGLKINVNDSQKLNKTAVAAWQRSEGKNPEGGLNAKGRASYKRETGGTLKAPVTESNPKGERASRQHSFCSRMCGMKSKNTGSKGQSDPDSRINKSLRKWNCKCGEDHDSLFEKVACLVKESKGRCWEGYKPVPGKEPYSNDSCEPVGAKKKKASQLEKEAGATPERIRELILKAAKGCKESSACLSRMSSSRKGKPAPRAAKVKPAASLPTVQPPADAQGMFPFAASHEFEVLKHKLDPSYALNSAKYLGKQADDEEQDLIDDARLKRRFKYWATKMRNHGVMAGTYHKRIAIPKFRLTENHLRRLGFEPVAIAIPEAGQDEFASYRNPHNLFHLHSHGKHWTMHEDEHPSLTMALRGAPIEEVPAAIVSGLSHIVTEGLPGAYKYISHRLTGAGNMLDAVMNETAAKQKNNNTIDAIEPEAA